MCVVSGTFHICVCACVCASLLRYWSVLQPSCDMLLILTLSEYAAKMTGSLSRLAGHGCTNPPTPPPITVKCHLTKIWGNLMFLAETPDHTRRGGGEKIFKKREKGKREKTKDWAANTNKIITSNRIWITDVDLYSHRQEVLKVILLLLNEGDKIQQDHYVWCMLCPE